MNKKAISLLEVTVILFIVGSIIAMMMPNDISCINNANYNKTVNELMTIAQASLNYFITEGSCPTTVNQLAPQFILRSVTSSPFKTSYQIACFNNLVTVSVLIPAGIAQKNPLGQLLVITNQGTEDRIQISKTVANEYTSRLNYDVKYVY